MHGSCGASDGGWSSSGSCQCHTWAGPSVNPVSTWIGGNIFSPESPQFEQHDCVNFICDHPDIRAISFVGGDPAGRHIYNRGSANGKRVQVLLRLSNLTLTLTIMFSVVQHGSQEPWSDHARCQQGICCQPGAWLIFIPLPHEPTFIIVAFQL